MYVGDRCVIQFYMNTATGKLLFVRDIVIKYANGPFVGSTFINNDPLDEHTGYFKHRIDN
ncbi:MAG: hypothetical protein JRK53_05570 [Deltaproteobacteria bacterium]|nr:hypothetical protein [Deltaproteobacteria bacterium]